MSELIGKSPIPAPLFFLGKLSFLASFLFFLLNWAGVIDMAYDAPFMQIGGISLFLAGLVVVVVGVVQLGQSRAFGLPETETRLKTHGIYRFTRNPMYVGGFAMCAGSCLYSLHPLNFLCAAVAIGTHMMIIRREEEFLAERFGKEWTDYQQRVPRYFRFFQRLETQ